MLPLYNILITISAGHTAFPFFLIKYLGSIRKSKTKNFRTTLKTRKESQGVTKPWKIYTNFRLIKQNQNFKYCLCT